MTGKTEKLDENTIFGEPLKIEYDLELDLLTLWTGKPASNGAHVARGLVVFYDEEDGPQIVTLEHAAEILLPYLTRSQASGNKRSCGIETTKARSLCTEQDCPWK